MLEKVLKRDLFIRCPNQGTSKALECDKFYGEVRNTLLLRCKNDNDEPLLVRFAVDVPNQSITVESCIIFKSPSPQVNIYLKYVSPNNDFVIIEVE